MSIFYDPQARKPQIWVYAAFVVIPILVIAIIFISGKKKAEQKASQAAAQEDIFAK